MTSQEFKTLLEKYSRGECNQQEEELILQWYEQIGEETNAEIKEEFRIIIESKIWSRLQKNIDRGNGIHHLSWTRRIAASVTILALASAAAFLVYWQINQKPLQAGIKSDTHKSSPEFVRYSNSHDVPEKITLADGSEVTLESQSEISYPKVFGDDREVHLTGAAFFEVKRDPEHPFLVYTNKVVTRVLGTSFTVNAYEAQNITVVVKTGRVSVYRMDEPEETKGEVILTPNQQAVYNRALDRVSKELVSKPEIIQKNSKVLLMEYEGAPVVSIFQALEQMYGVDIQYDDEILSNCTLTTSLQEEGLFERVKVICEAIGARYEVQGTSIIISSEGCHE